MIAKLTELLRTAGLTAEARAAAIEGADALVVAGRGRERYTLLLDATRIGDPKRALETIGRAHLRQAAKHPRYWVFGAPYVSERTAQLCQEGGIGYIDLAGNFELKFGPVILASRMNLEVRRERKVQRSLFSPRASRVALAFLLDPKTRWTQRALAGDIKISIGLVNRTIRELERQRFIAEEEDEWRLIERDGLLAAWAKHYATRRNERERFLTQAALEDVEARLDRDATEKGYRYALTLESAAKYRAPFVPATSLAFYCDTRPRDVAQRLGLKSVEHGWNVEILTPPDEGVFHKMRRITLGNRGADAPGLGRYITNDICLYLDLWSHPARGKEQAEHLLEVMAAEPRRRTRTTEQEALFHEFLNLRDKAHSRMREEKWDEALPLFDNALAKIEGLSDMDAEKSKETERFFSWVALQHLVRGIWDKDRKRRHELFVRINQEIPQDDEVLRRFPPFFMNHALVRYLLGAKHAIVAIISGGKTQAHEAIVATQHLKIANSPYTPGANDTIRHVEELRRWVRKVADIDLVV